MKIVVFFSGAGTNLKSILDHQKRPTWRTVGLRSPGSQRNGREEADCQTETPGVTSDVYRQARRH